jgi:hypothetical protein
MGLARSSLMRAALFTLAAAAMSACTVVEEGPGYRPGPGPIRPDRPDRPQACTTEYVPVCGERGSNRETFSNSCMARAAGFRVVSSGSCRGDGSWNRPDRPGRPDRPDRPGDRPGRPDRPDRPGWGDRPDRPDRPGHVQACTREYAPVCARQGSNIRTFGNACEARAANYRVVSNRPC